MAMNQHYVPQLLLRNFGNAEGLVHVYNKRTGATFLTNPRNAAAERDFYDFEFEGLEVTIEGSLCQLEDMTKFVLEGIIEKQNLKHLKRRDHTVLATFVAVQYVRTRAARNAMQQLGEVMANALRHRAAGNPEQLKKVNEFIGEPMDDKARAREHARLIRDASTEFAPMISEKVWWLERTTADHSFLICDNPVTLQNTEARLRYPNSPRGHLGLMSPGIEIYMPISPTLCLAMYDKELVDRLRKMAHAVPKKLEPELHAMFEAIKKGRPLDMAPANVENFNSLQIAGAETYVFSSDGNFELAKDMVANEPNINGPRFVVG